MHFCRRIQYDPITCDVSWITWVYFLAVSHFRMHSRSSFSFIRHKHLHFRIYKEWTISLTWWIYCRGRASTRVGSAARAPSCRFLQAFILYDCMTMYDYVWLCMTMYDYVWLCMTMYDYVWLCMTMYDYVWLCMTMYDYVWLCMTMYDYVWLCMTMYDYVWLCMTMYVATGYHSADTHTHTHTTCMMYMYMMRNIQGWTIRAPCGSWHALSHQGGICPVHPPLDVRLISTLAEEVKAAGFWMAVGSSIHIYIYIYNIYI